MPSSVIITIVVILGVIVAGGFLLYFMGDILMSLANRKKDAKVIKRKKDKDTQKIKDEMEKMGLEEELQQVPEIAEVLYGDAVVESYNPEDEEVSEEVSEQVEDEELVEDEEEDTEINEEEEEENIRQADIEQKRKDLMARLERLAAEDDEDEEDEDEEMIEEDEEEEEETIEVDEVNEETTVDNSALEAEKAKNIALMEELQLERAKLQEMKSVPFGAISLDNLIYMLEEKEERLKINEKELRACKKEYLPLRRVQKTLENDEKKLRRKEALVAKQKVVLYGVNNYADIDEEKAKKLAEDLDLLDGLKLSVEHCQEVMDKNKDRFPLLEKMYNVLTAQNVELKTDIEKLNANIEKLKTDKN